MTVEDRTLTVPGRGFTWHPKSFVTEYMCCFPCTYHVHIWELEVLLHAFLVAALEGDEWLASNPNSFTYGERTPLCIEQDAGWATKPVWTSFWIFWIRDKPFSLLKVEERFYRAAAPSLVTIASVLSRNKVTLNRITVLISMTARQRCSALYMYLGNMTCWFWCRVTLM